MMATNSSFYQSPEDKLNFNKGYEACFEDMSLLVKRLGKKYYKEFLLNVKNHHNRFYTSYTFTNYPHKCNCEYCELKVK